LVFQPGLAAQRRADSPIDVLERLEGQLKRALAEEFQTTPSGDRMRELASFQQQVGFLLKYKSYAIKAASPLGYSVFIQNPGEGFSFQRHVSHKTEIFHVLEVLPGGYVFICEFDEWARIYERDRFLAWLHGERDDRYERFRHRPDPGDVIVIDRLNVVHTVMGCVVAEFATVSTDMVDRLHDQNEGHPVPAQFSRAYAEARLGALSWPETSHLVNGRSRTALPQQVIQGGVQTRFGDDIFSAASYRIDAGAVSGIWSDPRRAVSLHVVEGSGQLLLGDAREIRQMSPKALNATAGDLFLVAPGAHYALANEGTAPLVVAEHRIPAGTAFI
jgi:mannose-6-phosphate isomerase-like protein (cupin superfamily)